MLRFFAVSEVKNLVVSIDPMSGQTALLVGLGGALGTLLRWAIGLGAERWPEFPWGTLAANAIGSFGLGVIAISLEGKRVLGVEARVVLGTGVMGGFTTYSTFNLETLRLIERGDHARAAAYVIVTLALCIAAGASGIALGHSLRGS